MDTSNFQAGQLYLGRDGKIFGPYSREQIETMRASGELAQYHWLWDGSGQWVAASLPPPPPPAMPNQATVTATTVPVVTAPTPSVASDEEKTEEIVKPAAMDLSASAAPVPTPAPVEEKAKRPSLFSRKEKESKAPAPVQAQPPQAPAPMARAPQPQAPIQSKSVPVTHHQPKQHPKNERNSPSVPVGSSIRAICFDRDRVIDGTLARATGDGCTFSLKLGVHPTKSAFVPGRPLMINIIDDATGRSENVRATLASGRRVDGKLELRLKWEKLPKLLGAQAASSAG